MTPTGTLNSMFEQGNCLFNSYDSKDCIISGRSWGLDDTSSRWDACELKFCTTMQDTGQTLACFVPPDVESKVSGGGFLAFSLGCGRLIEMNLCLRVHLPRCLK